MRPAAFRHRCLSTPWRSRGAPLGARLAPSAYNQNRWRHSTYKTMPRENLLTLLADFAHHSRDIAVVHHQGYRRQSFSYETILQKSAEFAMRLKSLGIRASDRVLLWAPNSAEWLIAFWGILLRGGVAVPMDDAARPEFAERVAVQASVKLIVSSPSHPRLATEAPVL